MYSFSDFVWGVYPSVTCWPCCQVQKFWHENGSILNKFKGIITNNEHCTPLNILLVSPYSICMGGICRVALLNKAVELQSCQKELTHAKLAHQPSGYSNWNVIRVCSDLSQHRKGSAASSKPASALGSLKSKLPLSTMATFPERSRSAASYNSKRNFATMTSEKLCLFVFPTMAAPFHCFPLIISV